MLYQLRWRKKKVNGFIIPPTYYKNSSFSIVEEVQKPTEKVEQIETKTETKEVPKPIVESNLKSFSEFSISSIKSKKEFIDSQKENTEVKVEEILPTEKFTEIQMLSFWFEYADDLQKKGLRIMEALLRVSDPKLVDLKIVYEVPNLGSKNDFEANKTPFLNYLKRKLNNHSVEIEVIVNEVMKAKTAFTPMEKFERLNDINPSVALLRKVFNLEI